jgi:hypothetical protein
LIVSKKNAEDYPTEQDDSTVQDSTYASHYTADESDEG